MSRRFTVLPVAVLFLGLALACGSGDDGTDATVQPDPGGASDVAGNPDVAGEGVGACSLVGTWSGAVPAGPFAGQTIAWTLAAGGTTSGILTSASIQGTWQLSGTTLTVTDTSSTPASIACPAGQAGTYTVTFSTDCGQATFQAVDEPCEGRKVVVDGFVGTLQG